MPSDMETLNYFIISSGIYYDFIIGFITKEFGKSNVTYLEMHVSVDANSLNWLFRRCSNI